MINKNDIVNRNDINKIEEAVKNFWLFDDHEADSSIPKFGIDIHIGDVVISKESRIIYRLIDINKNNILRFESEDGDVVHLDILSFVVVRDNNTGTSKVVHKGGIYNFYNIYDIRTFENNDSLDVPPISKDWFTKEWRLNNNNQSYRFKVRSIEYTDDRVMIRIIGEEPIDSDNPTSFYSGGTIRGKIPYDEFIRTFHMVIDE